MAFIITTEKSRRLSAREPLIYVTRDVEGEWRLFLPWFTVTIHQGDWHVVPVPVRKVDLEMQALLRTLDAPQG